jgi:transcriptional regulator with XRE-family HTH domain
MTIKLNLTLKKLLKESDMTVAQLSRATKVPVQTIHNWTHGQDPRSFIQVKKIADYFQITVDELVYGQSPKKFKESIEPIKDYKEEINAGVFEVVLRRIKK